MSGITGRTIWPWPLLAAAAGAFVVLAPIPAAIALGGAALVLLGLTAPRALVGLTVVVVLFVRPLEQLVPVATVGYADETLVALCAVLLPVRRLAGRERLRTFPGQWWFAAFLVAGLLSGLLGGVDPVVVGTGAFVLGKGLLWAWAVAQVDWAPRQLRVAARVGTVLLIGCLLAAAVNLVIPGPWESVLASDPDALQGRGPLPSLLGPFSHPIDLGQVMTLAAVALAAWRLTVRRGPLTLALLLATAATAVLTARRTAIGSLAVAWPWVQLVGRRVRWLLALVVCLPLAAVLLTPSLSTVVAGTYEDYFANDAEPAARTVLTVDSVAVAAEHFPGGAGFGRFGSAVAASTYSPEYVERGYPEIWGLGRTPEEGRFLTDTEWPAILGEGGFLGAFAFALGLLAVYRTARACYRRAGPPEHRWIGLTVLGATVACLVQSLATVTFTGPPMFGLYFGLVGVLAAVSDPAAAPGPDADAELPAARPPDRQRSGA